MSDEAKGSNESSTHSAGIDGAERTYEVGYGKPPKATRFPPGRSGNVSGRKRAVRRELDIDEILDKPIEVVSDGKPKQMEPRMIALLAQIKKAKGGNLQALAHVIEGFMRFGVLGMRNNDLQGAVVTLPNTMPFPMAKIMALRFGRPPWTKAQIVKGRADYLATCSDGQVRQDKMIGYPDL
jgi:hypothetical protein